MNKQQEESDSEDDFGPKPTNTAAHNNGNTTDYRNVFCYSLLYSLYILSVTYAYAY
jgi:hypothetical protein